MDLNDIKDSTEHTELGSEFQSFGPVTENAREHNTVVMQETLMVTASIDRV